MSSITGSASATLVSMLNAVNVTASTATRTIHTVANTLDMVDQYVQDARIAQITRSDFNRETMLQRIHEEVAIENAERQHELQRKISSDPVLAKLFSENYAKFDATRKAIETKIQGITNQTVTLN